MLLLDRSSAPMVRPGGGGGNQMTGVGDCCCRKVFILITTALAAWSSCAMCWFTWFNLV